MEWRKHWDRWGWAILLVVIALLLARALWGRGPFCGGSAEEHCLREWVSALSGWAAVAAAVPTVIFLSKQLSLARSQTYDDFRLQLRRSVALAKTSEVASQELLLYAMAYPVRPGYGADIFTWNSLRTQIVELQDMVAASVFTRLEEDIAFPESISQVFVLERIRVFLKEHGEAIKSTWVDDADRREETYQDFNRICAFCEQYAEACKAVADDFIADTSDMLSRYA